MDTGSNRNIISENVLNSNGISVSISHSNARLKGIGGKDLGIIGECTLPIKIANTELSATFIVISELNFVIVGMTTMRDFKIEIDMSSETVTCGELTMTYDLDDHSMGLPVTLCHVQSLDNLNVRLARDEIIPAGGRKIVEVEVYRNVPSSEFSLLECDFGSQRYGSVIPACVVRTGRKAHVMISNTIDKPIKFGRHSNLGFASETTLPREEEALDLLSDKVSLASPDGHPLNLLHSFDHLTKEQREDLEKICLTYHTVFSRDDLDIGKCRFEPVRLDVKEDAKVVREPPRKYNNSIKQTLSSYSLVRH